MSLLIVLRRTMSLKDLGELYDSLLGLGILWVRLDFFLKILLAPTFISVLEGKRDIVELKWIAEDWEICLFANTLLDTIIQDGS